MKSDILTVKQALAKYEEYEWYDNHRIDVIQACHRKAFYHLIGPSEIPLAMGVGDAANFGTVWHAGLARYYAKLAHNESYDDRVANACRRFYDEWQRQFRDKPDIENKYKLGRSLQQLVMYFDNFKQEDEYFDVIDSEIGFAVLFKPRIGEPPFLPFVFAGRIDRLVFRRTMLDRVIGETKTGSGDPGRRAKELRFDRQTRGYNYVAKRMDAEPVAGVLVDVAQITATKLTNDVFYRDYFPLNESDGDSWRRQTINIVEQWRALERQAKSLSGDNGAVLDVYDQRTRECTTYGICPFYDLCLFGINADNLSKYKADTWHPLVEEQIQTVED